MALPISPVVVCWPREAVGTFDSCRLPRASPGWRDAKGPRPAVWTPRGRRSPPALQRSGGLAWARRAPY